MLIDALRTRRQTISFCESLTAGLASATLADVPGASTVLRGGLVTYATELKHKLAHVPQELLDAHGPVSAPTAAAMAAGCRQACGSDWAVSLTGVAGPEGQDGHPVGEVWLGFAGPGGVDTQVLHLTGSRREIREEAVAEALTGALQRVREQNNQGRR
ncbi:CinA family protein [Corynebacterium atrinae]|uniref:CinA family protein n=1 Tax=Corynebacterium atrinae TaxID=1336740 RepID=UPI0025B48908|nr:CinA family protein [Corynebacterium atrinae]